MCYSFYGFLYYLNKIVTINSRKFDRVVGSCMDGRMLRNDMSEMVLLVVPSCGYVYARRDNERLL